MLGVLALLLLAGIVVGVVTIVRAVSGGTAGQDGAPSSSPSPTATPTPTEQPTAPLPTACTAEQATLGVVVPPGASAGSGTTATIEVSVAGDQPCLVNLGSEALEVEVYSGEDLVWSSAQCPFTPAVRELLLPGGATDVQKVRWSGLRSREGCASDVTAPAGTYRMVATQTYEGERLTGEATFQLVPVPEPEPDPEVSAAEPEGSDVEDAGEETADGSADDDTSRNDSGDQSNG